MESFLMRLSTYNILNYFIPGIIFVTLLKHLCNIELFVFTNIVERITYYYVIGSVISQTSALVFEKLCRKINFVKYASYEDYLNAEAKDKKINILSEENNMYRTFATVFFLLFLIELIGKIVGICAIEIKFCLTDYRIPFLLVLFTLYLFSYKRRTKYIVKRINNIINKNKEV